MSPELTRSCAIVARVMPAEADWWIIGSAALALSGFDVSPQDVDVFGATDVIEAARLKFGAPMKPSGSPHFRSTPYFQVQPEGGLEIDLMGGLELYTAGAWTALRIESRVRVDIAGGAVFIPSLEEQLRVLQLFGRPKDLIRAALIEERLAAR